jgi:Acetylornithine deacetylase/Succinyl-diaminopimelate desuccinylase and related deacylases
MEKEAVSLLRELIKIPSYSFEEKARADYLQSYLYDKGIKVKRLKNNLICTLDKINSEKPMLMLNSHIDTVKASDKYSFNPFEAKIENGLIYGLGSNDAGASVVSLIETFLYFNNNDEFKGNIILVLSAEEERSGNGGMKEVVNYFKQNSDLFPQYAIIGEPTNMHAAIGERGLLVLDGVAEGVSGHAANSNNVNALYIAIDDIIKLKEHQFTKYSDLMGEVKLSVTQITSGTVHNIIPDKCSFVVDIRTNEKYTNLEIYNELQKKVKSILTPRRITNKSSITPSDSKLIKCAKESNIKLFVSPTTSDWMEFPNEAIKMGPGDSSRSHKADEYISINEIKNGIETYIDFIKNFYKQ